MNIKFMRAIDRHAGAALCGMLSVWHALRKRQPAPESVNKILVILLSEMGSLVLAHGMFSRLKTAYPKAALYIAVFERNSELLEILNVLPTDRVLRIRDTSAGEFIGDFFKLLIKLRAIGFDVVIDCELFARISSIISFLSGAPLRVGFHPHTQEGLYRGSFINRPVLYNPYRHMSQQFEALAAALSSQTVPLLKQPLVQNGCTLPKVSFSVEEANGMRTRLTRDFPLINAKRLVLLYPGGGLLPIRAWPLDRYGLVAKNLLKSGYAVGIIGLKQDGHLAARLTDLCADPACIDLTGYTKTLKQLMLLLKWADLLITNDGGPGHFAALASTPAIILFGPETPLLYGPLENRDLALYRQLPCSPCLTAYNHRNSPCDGDNQCLKSILPGEVLAKALGVLQPDTNFLPVE